MTVPCFSIPPQAPQLPSVASPHCLLRRAPSKETLRASITILMAGPSRAAILTTIMQPLRHWIPTAMVFLTRAIPVRLTRLTAVRYYKVVCSNRGGPALGGASFLMHAGTLCGRDAFTLKFLSLPSAQPLHYSKIVRPFRAELRLELLVGNDALGDQELGERIGHARRTHHNKFFMLSG